jgi:hypothetical protein
MFISAVGHSDVPDSREAANDIREKCKKNVVSQILGI